jgi:hypothetical protein
VEKELASASERTAAAENPVRTIPPPRRGQRRHLRSMTPHPARRTRRDAPPGPSPFRARCLETRRR